MTDADNEKVTLAILGVKIDNLNENLSDGFERIESRLSDHETRLRSVEDKAKSNEQRLGMAATGQAIFTTIAAVLAGWFGSR